MSCKNEGVVAADPMAVCCAAGAPLAHEYSPKGVVSFSADKLPMYTTSGGTGLPGVVVLPDLFSWPTGPAYTGTGCKQVLQFCDRLAVESKTTVVLIDPFRGEPWPMEKFPPKPEDDFRGWMAAWDYAKVGPDVDATVSHLQAAGAKKLAIVGFCWGAVVAFPAGHSSVFSAVGGVHAGFQNKEDSIVGPVQCPVILLQADGDPLDSVKAVTDTKPYADQCVYHHFAGQVHGFCGARGDFTQPDVAAAAALAVTMMSDFLKKHLA